MSTNPRLSAGDWTTVALDALLNEGPDAVSVQPLARRLGATRGSFYWHFASRDDLLRAALERWHQVSTEDVITAVEAASDDPRERARLLFVRVTAASTRHPGELRLLAAASHPAIGEALERATRRRISYVAGLAIATGQPAPVAARRAFLAYAIYLGHAQLAQATPQLLPQGADDRRELLEEMARTLFAG
jgi:AcrR family transcriptional regulator